MERLDGEDGVDRRARQLEPRVVRHFDDRRHAAPFVADHHAVRVEEFDFESASRKQLRGNIYLAKVTRVEPSLQATSASARGITPPDDLRFSTINAKSPEAYPISAITFLLVWQDA